ncbi:hypothetical protein FDUTEX481_00891 [Tolypothrix sp. PCC 7601]|nr:hypothetical protein FDUTEX481_00891 [Tolypothrix sp. PCC 7601]
MICSKIFSIGITSQSHIQNIKVGYNSGCLGELEATLLKC